MIIDSFLFLYFSFIRYSSQNIIFKFTKSFNDESIIEHCNFFKYTKNRKYENAMVILSRVTRQIRDVIQKLETDEYKDLKRLILNTQIQSFYDINFFYFETFVAIRSIQRILNINKNNQFVESWYTKKQMMELHKTMINLPKVNLRYPTHYNVNFFYEKLILFEIACIYNDIIKTMKIISKKYPNYRIIMNPFSIIDFDFENCFPFNRLRASNINYFIEYSKNTIHSILNIDRDNPICVITSPYGITHSVKCSQEFTKIYMPQRYRIIDKNEEIQELDKIHTKHDGINQSDIDFILDKSVFYNRSIMKLFIVLIHYHSVINNVEYKYEFSITKYQYYKVKCSKYDIKAKFKFYYLEKDIPNNCKVKTIPKFSSIIEYDKEYTTIKPDDINVKPINTRVIKLSCGHLLGLELIDEWFNMFPDLKCHLCMVYVTILGSFDTDIYKC